MQACLSEGMRVYPPVPTLTREAERDMDLGGYKIEKGTMLGVAVFSMHNNPAYWKVGELCLAPLWRLKNAGSSALLQVTEMVSEACCCDAEP